ncbi:MAG: hypothetical protein LAQ69_33330 [Acidobacteriia bacterium]|nr:hypothetical protein [Terriglobia bacterium]
MNGSRFSSLAAVFAGLVFITSASAQNVSVVSGNGQVLGGNNFALQPLVVQVTDATGAPVAAGTLVNWQSSGFSGVFLLTGTNTATSATDSNGQATIVFNLPFATSAVDFTKPYVQTAVTAAVNNGTGNAATFTLTQLASAPNGSVAPQFFVNAINVPYGNVTLTGAIGGTSSPPIQLQLQATNGLATAVLPNVALVLLNYQDPALGPLVACARDSNTAVAGQNTVLTDSTGTATCTPIFGGQPGQGRFAVTVGGLGYPATASPAGFWAALDPTDPNSPQIQTALKYLPANMSVTPGAPGSIKIISPAGGTTSATSGTSNTSLTVEVDNASGQPLAGATVAWSVVSPTTGATVNASSTTTGSNGQTSTTVSFASTLNGTVRVTATVSGASPVTFTISVAPPVTIIQFQKISGDNQSAVVNSPFAQPLVVQVNSTTGVAPNVPVQFTVTGGSVSLSATTATTDSNGRAQVNVTAGSVTGAANVQASLTTNAGIGSLTFSLTVLPSAPNITAGNFVNGADQQRNSLSPCGIGALVVSAGSLGVSNISPTFPGGPVPSTNVQLTFANVGAPILDIGNNSSGQQQILFQVPCEVAPGSAVPVTLSVGGGVTNINLAVQAASPGVYQTRMSDGAFRAVLVRPDGSSVSLANPARRGEIVIAYATGLGLTAPSVGTGSVPAPGGTATVQGTVVPGIGTGGAQLVSAQLSPDLPGIYAVAFQIPSDSPTGNDVPFSIGVVPPGSSTALYSALSKIPVQ